MSIHVRRATLAEVERYYGIAVDLPAFAYIGEAGGTAVGCGGLAWAEGRCWLFFNAEPGNGTFPFAVMRMAQRMQDLAVALGEQAVYVTQDTRFDTSERLIRLLGFTPLDETFREQKVWVWHVRL